MSLKKHIFGTKLNFMKSISKQIKQQIIENEKGKIYFVSDFNFPGSEEAIKKTLIRLENSSFLVRLSHGIYLYPKRNEHIGILYPSIHEIAQAISSRDKSKIMPTGALAMNLLGFSTQVPMNAVYITTGTPRNIQIGKRKIVFKKAAPKNFQYKSKLMAMIVFALREIGEGNINDEIIQKIEEQLSIKKEILLYREDLSLAPVWIKKILVSIINKLSHE